MVFCLRKQTLPLQHQYEDKIMSFLNPMQIVRTQDWAIIKKLADDVSASNRNAIVVQADPNNEASIPVDYQSLTTFGDVAEPTDRQGTLCFVIQPKQALAMRTFNEQLVVVLSFEGFETFCRKANEREAEKQAYFDRSWRVRPGTREGYTELTFEGTPSEDIRTTLKQAGYRWARTRGCWYGATADLPERFRVSQAKIADELSADICALDDEKQSDEQRIDEIQTMIDEASRKPEKKTGTRKAKKTAKRKLPPVKK